MVGGAEPLALAGLLADLAGRGIGRLMVEGGAEVLGQFLAAGLADELRLAVAPVLVADPGAPRLVALPPGEPPPGDRPPGDRAPGDRGRRAGRRSCGWPRWARPGGWPCFAIG